MLVIYAPWNAFEPSTEAGSARTDADETAASAGEVEEANSGALVGRCWGFGAPRNHQKHRFGKRTKQGDIPLVLFPKKYPLGVSSWDQQIEFFLILVLGSTEWPTCCESVGSSRTSASLAKCRSLVEDGKRRTERTPPRGPFPGAKGMGGETFAMAWFKLQVGKLKKNTLKIRVV